MFPSQSQVLSAKPTIQNSSNTLEKSHSTSSFDSSSHRPHITPHFSANKQTGSFINKSPLKTKITPDTLPQFGSQIRHTTFGASPKGSLDYSRQNENNFTKMSESLASPLKSSALNQYSDFHGKFESECSSNKSMNASSNLKQSNSYINAMKALQKKVKDLEENLYKERSDLEGKYKSELDIVHLKFEKDRRSQQELENKLRNEIDVLEEELNTRERTIEDLTNEIAKLRKISYEVESERTNEVQKLVNDKKRLKDQYKELEEKYLQKLKTDEELRSKNIQAEYALREKENEVLELRETISKLEKEKIASNNQFEQKLAEAISKNKLAEEKRKDIEAEFQDEIQRRFQQYDELESENKRLKAFIGELEENSNQMERIIINKESEVEDKSAQILQLREELQMMMREVEKLQVENERTHSYAQDMAQMNQRLLSNMMGSRASKEFSDFELNQEMQKTIPMQEYNRGLEGSLSMDYLSRNQPTEEQIPVFTRMENQRYSKTPRVRDRNMGNSSHMRGYSLGSPGHNRKSSFFQGVKFIGEDLSASEMGGRRNRQEARSPQKSFSHFDNRSSMNISKLDPIERIAEMKRNANREAGFDKLELERVIKEIIEIQKEMLEYNKECQILMNDMMVSL